MKKNGVIKAEIIIILAIVLAVLLPQIIGTTKTGSKSAAENAVSSLAEMDGLTFITSPGNIFDDIIQEYFPSSERIYTSDWSQMALAVEQGKADAFLMQITSIKELTDTYPELSVFPVPLCQMGESFAAAKTEKGAEIVELFNEYLSIISADGTLDAVFEKWGDSDTAPGHVEIPKLTGERGTINVGICLDWSPYCYETGEGPCGSFIELTYSFCAWAGYIPEIEYVDFSSILAGVSTGKYDFIPVGMTYSEERAEEMYFTEALFGDYAYVGLREEMIAFPTVNTEINDYKNKGVSVALLSGNDNEADILAHFPDAKIMYFDTLAEICTAVSNGKADLGTVYDDTLESITDSLDNVAMVYQPAATYNYAFSFQKNEDGAKLQGEFNEFLKNIKADGRYSVITKKWASGDESVMRMEEYSYSGENGILCIGTVGTWYPKTYYIGDELIGEYIEFVCAFCEEYGYTPEFNVMPFTSELTGILSGELDIIADAVPVTAERMEQLNFSEVVLTSDLKLITRAEGGEGESVSKFSAFTESIKSSFEKNFLRENRWKMLLSGFTVTLELSVLAGVFGTVLGALIAAMRMSRNNYLSGFARIYIKLIQGTPIVVLLLVLYYVVFGSSNIPAFIVCALGFSVDFAAYAAEIFRSGIAAVPDGQRMAARALGFSRGKAFIKVVLPQAMIHILPVYSGQFIAMVKMTSVAGYISVQDLTKVSDIIRSRTYEAFFPLISTAVIYFIISALLVSMLKLAERRIDPALRKRKLKGVNTNVD